MSPFAGIKFGVSRCSNIARDAEQRAKGVERIEAPVEAKREFVEVSLQMLMTNPVMSSSQPGFEVGEHQMDNRQIFFGNLRVAALGDSNMLEPTFLEFAVAAPVISNNRRTLLDRSLHKAAQRCCAAIRRHGKPDATGVTPVPALVQRGAGFALFHFDSAGNQHHIVDATAFAACPTTNPCFVCFYVLSLDAADPVLVGPNHTGAQLVEYLESGFVARQPELALELHRRHPCGLAGNQISRPKPYLKRRVRELHDGSNRQSSIAKALAAPHYARTVGKTQRIPYGSAIRADKPGWPAQLQQVGNT